MHRIAVLPPSPLPSLAVSPDCQDALLRYLAPQTAGLTLAAVQPPDVSLMLEAGQWWLAVSLPKRRSEPAYRLPVLPDWHPVLLQAFAPELGSLGRLHLRPCRIRLDWGADGLGLCLEPQSGTRTTLVIPPGTSLDWLGLPTARAVAAAAVVAAMPVLPVAAREYVVRPGDTLYGISRTVLANANAWRQLHAANKDRVPDPRRMMPGTRLRLPEVSLPPAGGARSVVIRPGDTLYALAQRHLGNGARWPELWRSIRSRVARPEQLPVGFVLALPPAAAAHTAKTPQPPATRPAVMPVAQATPQPVPRPAMASDGAARPSPVGPSETAATAQPPGPPFPPPSDRASVPTAAPSDQASVPKPSATASELFGAGASDSLAQPDVAASPVAAVPSTASDAVARPSTGSDVATGPSTASDVAAGASAEPAASPVASDAAIQPAGPVAKPASLSTTIERPFGSHLRLSYTPLNHTEATVSQPLSGEATVFTSFGAGGAWRPTQQFELAGTYLFNHYVVDRGSFGQGPRQEQHGRLMGYYVWPVLPHLELAAGLGAQAGLYGPAVMPVSGRAPDYYDSPYQRVMAETEVKLGFRPHPDWPLTLTAGVSALPYGVPLQATADLPAQFWGLGWQAGARYSLGHLALETGYRGQRVWGTGFQQSSDLLHGSIGYYFN